MISIMDDNAISLTFSTSNLSRSATHFKAFCNNNHIWYTSPGLSPSQAPGFGKPSIRAWLTILKAQAHQSQAQAWALSPSQARYITIFNGLSCSGGCLFPTLSILNDSCDDTNKEPHKPLFHPPFILEPRCRLRYRVGWPSLQLCWVYP